MSDIEAVAAALTEAQRRALVQTHCWDGYITHSETLASLRDLGLLVEHVMPKAACGWGASYTPLGLHVAQHLLQSPNTSGHKPGGLS